MKIRKPPASGWCIYRAYDETSTVMQLAAFFPKNGGGTAFATLDTDLIENPIKLRKALVQRGAKFGGTIKAQVQLVRALLSAMPASEVILTTNPGFRGDGFVCGPNMLGDAKGKYVWMPDDSNKGLGDQAGTLEGWKAQVATPAAKSSYAVLCIAMALGSCLPTYVSDRIKANAGLRPLCREGAVTNLSGNSSAGKSIASAVAASVGGNPNSMNDWDFSRRGLEEAAAAHNDFPFVMDDTEKHTGIEMTLISALKAVNQVIPKGKSKAIAKSSREQHPALTWSCFAISSSPRPIDEIAETLKWKRSPGEKVRLFDIAVPHPDQGGIFDRATGNRTVRVVEAQRLVKQIASGMATNYGHLLPVWIEWLLKQDRAARVQKLVDSFVRRVAPHSTGPETRLAEKFGIFYAAAKMAVDAGLLPWDKNLPWKAVTRCYRLALKSLTTEKKRASALIQTIADMQSDPRRFPMPKPGSKKPIAYGSETVGIKTKLNGKLVCAIRDGELRKLAGSAKTANELLKQLRAAHALVAGQGHAGTKQLSHRIMVGGKTSRARFWVILTHKLLSAVSAQSTG